MAFGVPELVAGRDADGTLAASVKGYQPDILVAVCKGPYNMDPRFPYSARPAPANAPASKFQLFPAT
jgi:hypothetical protein